MPKKEEIEPRFAKDFAQMAESEYERGVEKYGHTLLTYNGYDGYKEGFSEGVALLRYFSQVQMEKEQLEVLLTWILGELHYPSLDREVIINRIEEYVD